MPIHLFSNDKTILGWLSGQHRTVYAKVKPELAKNSIDNPFNVQLNACGFILKRSNKVFGKERGLIVSSVGLLILPPSVIRILRMQNERDLWSLFQASNGWRPGEAEVISILYKDSPMSGILAKRIVHLNDYAPNAEDKAAEDAKWRAEHKAPATPKMVTGSSNDYGLDPNKRMIQL